MLAAAKRLRAEILKLTANETVAKSIPKQFKARDNLSLYTRLVRVQTAAYHQSATTRSTPESKPASKDMDEDFKFVPPTNAATGANPGGAGSAWNFQQFTGNQDQKQGNESSGNANSSAGAQTHSKENPLPVYIVPTTLSWLTWGLSAVVAVVIIMVWTNSGSEGGALSSLLGNRFEIAEPGELTFDDVKGNAEAKEELFDVVEYLKDPAQYAKLGIKIPKGILLTGPPGTGKTMLARVVASESGVPFISTSGAEFEEMLVGVGARRVRQLFQLAKKNAPCIVFIDEIDAVGAKREDESNSHHRMSINQLLVEMDGFSPNDGIVVIGATNLSEVLDPALVRPGRFDRKVGMELPDPRARKEILDHYLKNKTLASDVATGVLARACAGFSGADLETMVNWAAIISSKKKTPIISMKMLEEALFNVAMGRERKSLVLNDFTRKLCAYHEGGHALVSLHTPGSLDIRRATLVPRGQALGMVNYLSKEDSPLTTRQELLARMDTAMGGRAAEHLIYGEDQITQGAGSDFEQATNVATAMVTQLGMSPLIGPVSIPTGSRSRISTETQHIIEQETRRLCMESYDRAYNILQAHEKELHLLAAALLKYESLTVDEIKRVIAGDPLEDKQRELEISKTLDQQLAEETAAARVKRREEVKEKRLQQQQQAEKNKKKKSGDEPAVNKVNN